MGIQHQEEGHMNSSNRYGLTVWELYWGADKLSIALLLLAVMLGSSVAVQADENPAVLKWEVKGRFDAVLEDVKSGLGANQFTIESEHNLARALARNRHVFAEGQWNTIGFREATALSFCSVVFNQKVFNLNMDYSILCPFKVVLYSMDKTPNKVTIIMVRPTYLLAHFPDPSAEEIANKIEHRIVAAIREAIPGEPER
jgi:uncharacterized protein (DUF302 family)